MTTENQKETRPIKVEAFRFVHLKKPEIYTATIEPYIFVSHPAKHKSKILNKDETFRTSFVPFAALDELQKLNAELYAFIFWLKKHRTNLDREQLEIATAKIELLSEEQALVVWDNLLHQAQTANSSTLTEGLIRVLQANHFLTRYREDLKQDKFAVHNLKKAAKASVIIPHELFDQETKEINRQALPIDVQSRKFLSNRLEIDVINHQIRNYKRTLEELAKAERAYIRDNKREYEQAYKAYEAQLDELMQQSQELTNEAGTIKICGKEIAPFSFSPSTSWSEDYLKDNVSAESWRVYQASEQQAHDTIEDTKQAIVTALPKLYRQSLQKVKKQAPKTLIHKGIRLPIRNRPLNNAYVFKAVLLDREKDLYSIRVVLLTSKAS